MFNELKHWMFHEKVDTGNADGLPAELRTEGNLRESDLRESNLRIDPRLDLRVHQADFAAERARIAELSALLARAVADMRSEHFETGTEGYIVSVTRDWIDETTAESALSEG